MDDFEEWRRYWSSRYGRELSEYEVKEIRDNLTGFFKILIKVDRRTAEQGEKSHQQQENPESE